ncbi:MAG: family 43 glycosylhydrolase [Myxococcota bacterium]
MLPHSFTSTLTPIHRVLIAALWAGWAWGCSSDGSSDAGSGGAQAGGQSGKSGGQTGSGGASNSPGGSSAASGGASAGGATGAGGASNNGGSSSGGSSSGGSSSGGSSSGGSTGIGGASAGGTAGAGGDSAKGGSSSGGTSNGGTSNGGTSNGGASKGGSLNGGAPNGGKVGSGGTAAGGSGSGGTSAAGGTSAMGGTTATGGSGSCSVPAPGSKGKNPLFTDVFTADPAPFVHNCTFYIHCGHDQGAGNFFDLSEWYVLKSTDMVNWTRTLGMRYTVFSWAHGNAWAGQLVAKNGKFYWYVPVEQGNGNGQMAIGVAVSDSPEGPFKDAIGKPLVDDAFERQNMGFATDGDTPYTIDPTVLVDDNGDAYLHYGGFSRLVNAKLGADMISISGTMKESTPSCFFEAPFLTKRNNIYYEIYACGVNPPTIDYATSSSPLGPWTRKGTVLPRMTTLPGQDAATNHAGVAKRGDQWYITYHVSNGPNGGGTYHREVAIDKLNFNSDGSIQQVTPSSGLTF